MMLDMISHTCRLRRKTHDLRANLSVRIVATWTHQSITSSECFLAIWNSIS